ncbi:MAG: efflux RND transporter periplasmic adaptor subunit [Deltaproteobacteria bacterium]|nr:efflux RND transporter periplasmic adaptor subunit [Deltaproteobacteria bacterium]MBW2047171.1 efflux RND transporter periplasmic adaptor subunit [Deltaproteobacteria bacterium]MBW2352558.1 efflux RND transporter periplasmic adaptor subunit [Deltaproteobacteria bacterium]HDZ89413.1 efflux RND transporter periplasmic adaptor subunit [Deltaproteobacteria bacterium]
MGDAMLRGLFFFAGVLLLCLCGCGDGPEAGVDKGPRLPAIRTVQVSPVSASLPTGDMEYVGVLTAYRKVKVSSELGGVVEGLYFEKGDNVNAGKLLAEIGTSTLRLQVQEAEAAVNAARSVLRKMEKGSRPQEIEIATAALREAEASLKEAEKNYRRMKELHEINAVSGSSYDAAVRQVATAKARKESARQRLLLARKGPREEDIEGARAALAQARATLALTRNRLHKSMLHAPCDGIAAFRRVERGEVIGARTPITEIVQLEKMKIRLSVGEKDIHILKTRRRFSFTVDAIPGEEFTCRLLFLSPTADPLTRSFPIELMVDRTDRRMADGMTVRVRFPDLTRSRAPKIPSAWLSEEEGKMGVYVLKDGKALFRPVTLGAYYDNRVEILSGIGEKDLIITNPAGLKNGVKVKVGR